MGGSELGSALSSSGRSCNNIAGGNNALLLKHVDMITQPRVGVPSVNTKWEWVGAQQMSRCV